MPTTHGLLRFDGEIAGLGSASGVRVVLGMWRSGPFGPMADAMVEDAAGHRVLVAPSRPIAAFISATYRFDEVRIEPVRLEVDGDRRVIVAPSLQVEVRVGSRTAVGRVLAAVPGPLARSRAWCRLIDPVARRMRPGVRTVGTAGGGRREFYGATDERHVRLVAGSWLGRDLGELRPVTPAVRFGFGSTPTRPSVVRVTTTISGAGQSGIG